MTIGDVPIGQLTLKQIVTDLFGLLLFVGVPNLIFKVARDNFAYDLGERDFCYLGTRIVSFAFVAVFILVGLGLVYVLSKFAP